MGVMEFGELTISSLKPDRSVFILYQYTGTKARPLCNFTKVFRWFEGKYNRKFNNLTLLPTIINILES